MQSINMLHVSPITVLSALGLRQTELTTISVNIVLTVCSEGMGTAAAIS